MHKSALFMGMRRMRQQWFPGRFFSPGNGLGTRLLTRRAFRGGVEQFGGRIAKSAPSACVDWSGGRCSKKRSKEEAG